MGKQKIEIAIAGAAEQFEADLALRLLPSPRLVIEFDGTISSFAGINQVGPFVKFLPQGTSVPASPSSFSFSFDAGVRGTLLPRMQPFTALSTRKRLQSVKFSVINFPEIFGGHLGGVQLKAGPWQIEVIAVPDLNRIVENLKETGGYAITHIGLIERSDRTFTESEAKDLLEGLRLFLSFARGSFCSLTFQTGLDRKSDESWKQMGAHTVAPWGYAPSWFDTMHGSILTEVFPGFWQRLNDPGWTETIRASIYWYLRSNGHGRSTGVDGGLILTQSALERISYVYLGQQSGRASDQIRQTLAAMRISTKIPPSCRKIRSLARQNAWQDAPHALTEIRNELVHPKQKYGKPLSDAYFEAWNLGQRYIELMLLRLFRHRGKHANRLTQQWRGQVVGVPWR